MRYLLCWLFRVGVLRPSGWGLKGWVTCKDWDGVRRSLCFGFEMGDLGVFVCQVKFGLGRVVFLWRFLLKLGLMS